MSCEQDVFCRPICIEETFPLRHSVLWPGKPVSHVFLPEDEKGVHLGAFLASRDQPVAVISLFVESVPSSSGSLLSQSGVEPGEPGQVRFRKFACDPEYQGQGIGTKLLQHAIIIARSDMSAKIVWCDARTSSSGWYQKRGLTPFGEIFFKNAVEYVRMYIDVRNSVSL